MYNNNMFTEAVFIDGKKSVEPILNQIRSVKKLLDHHYYILDIY